MSTENLEINNGYIHIQENLSEDNSLSLDVSIDPNLPTWRVVGMLEYILQMVRDDIAP